MSPPPRVAVVGAGITGLAAAWSLRGAAARAGRPLAVDLVEAEPRCGGRISSERRDGFLLESGPDSFVARKPAALELARELGLGDRLVQPPPERDRVWILRGGRLLPVPPGSGVIPCRLAPVFASELLSWHGKLRLALDLVLPPRRRPRPGDESLADLLARRFGSEAVERLLGPLVAGIYATAPEALSVAATFPHFAEIERRRGSLIRGLRSTAAGAGAAGAAGGSLRLSLAGGVGELVTALHGALAAAGPVPVAVSLGRAVRNLRPPGEGGSWGVELAGGARLAADAVVLAVPAFGAADLVAPFAPRLAAVLRQLRYVSTAAVHLAYRAEDLPPLEGLGFVVPGSEGRRLTACTFASVKFPGRAPAGWTLLRAFLGGPGRGALLDRDDDDLVAVARGELEEILGVTAAPGFTAVHRQPRGIPRYEVGHRERVAAAEAALPAGLLLAGAGYRGLGVPDCISDGRRAAAAALTYLDALSGAQSSSPPAPTSKTSPRRRTAAPRA